jgi:anaerobic selenocysteine-containing dehydrogenase
MVDQTKLHNNYVDENGVLWKKARCFQCHLNCSIFVGSVDGKAVELAPNAAEGVTLCERIGDKGEKALKFHDHPNRINYAHKRVGERGDDKWEKIPYDQAVNEIAEKLTALGQEFGPETLTFAEGTYRSDHFWARARFATLFGNPNNLVDAGQICGTWTTTQQCLIYGWPCIGFPFPNPVTGTYVNPGARIMERYSQRNLGDYWTQQFANPDRGRIITVDPVCTEFARNSDIWLAVRPGTDLAYMLCWANTIYQEGLHDVEFLTNWTNAPFLLRSDTNKLLREPDLMENGNSENFVAWDKSNGKPVVWVPDEMAYRSTNVEIALEGVHEVTLVDGSTVTCHTVMTKIVERLAEYSVEKVSWITGVPRQKLLDSARMFATQKPSVIDWGLGGSGDQHGYNAMNTEIAKGYLRCFTGSIDNPGGQMVGRLGPYINGTPPVRDGELELNELATPEIRKKFLGYEEFPLSSWKIYEVANKWHMKHQGVPKQIAHHILVQPRLAWEAIETGKPYPVKAMIVWAGNPMAWAPDTKRVMQALKKLDLLVVVEYWKTPTAALADYILPAADWMERPIATTNEDMLDVLSLGDRGVPPLYDRHIDYDFFRKLGLAMGQDEKYWPWQTYEEAVAYRVKRCGVSYDDGRLKGFATASGRVEIYCSDYEQFPIDPVSFYREPPESPISTPDLAQEYPLVLTTGGRIIPLYHSEGRVPGTGTRSMYPWPEFTINPETARQHGIRSGDWCWIETPRGRICQRAKVDTTIGMNTIIAQASWWYPELPAAEPSLSGGLISNANMLTSSDLSQADPNVGCWVNRGLLCKVYPCEEAPEWFKNSKYNQA